MRDINLMVSLLEKMEARPDGQMSFITTLGMSMTERERFHNGELLVDAGLATWTSESAMRITNDGYDFLNAFRQDPQKYKAKAEELFSRGKSLLHVARDIISIVNAL